MSFVPYFSYQDPASAINFLEAAFGFERVLEQPGDDGGIVHAEMGIGDTRVMLGLGAPPEHSTITETSPRGHGVYVVIDDVDAHHAKASEAGAHVVYPPEDTEFGTRRYRVLDLDGYEWSFGTYDPSAPKDW